MLNTHIRNVRQLRNNYSEIAGLIKNRDQVVITNHGKGEAVIISFEDFADFEEYRHFKYVEEKLAEAENEAKDPKAVFFDYDEVMSEYRNEYGYEVPH